jgi:hypothetical protein
MKAGSLGLHILLVRGGVRIKRKSNENKCKHLGDDEGTGGETESDGVGLATSKREDEPFYAPEIKVNPQYFLCLNDINNQSIYNCTFLSNF